MEPATASIPARSHRQAMDWSLVLISQGIESTIEPAADGSGWVLQLPIEAQALALEALHQYQRENRHWPWRRLPDKQGILFDWAALVWVFLLALFFSFNETGLDLRAAGEMASQGVSHGEWWRLFTAIWLHADVSHLAGNATLGGVLLGLVMGRYGTGTGLFAAYLAGASGNLLDWLLSFQTRYSLGASGMVMGCLGLLATHSLSLRRHTPARIVLGGILAGVMLFVLLGLSPGADVQAHFGGFLGGLLLGACAAFFPKFARSARLNLLSGLLFTLLVIWPWWLAFRHAWAAAAPLP